MSREAENAEPVAYRHKYPDESNWSLTIRKPRDLPQVIIEPLYTGDPSTITISQQEYTALCLSAEVSGWSDIETAPKDGTIILGWHDSWHGYHLIMWDSSEGYWREGSWCFTYPPSHWQYLPPPPSDPSPVTSNEASKP